MKKKKATTSAPAIESGESTQTTSKFPVEIGGKTYNLSFDLADLAKAESMFRKQGHKVSLLVSLPSLTLDGVRDVFPCAVNRYHPELSWADAQALVTMQSAYPIATAIVAAWEASTQSDSAAAKQE